MNKVNLCKTELNLLNNGDLELINYYIEPQEFVKVLNEIEPGYENTYLISSILRNYIQETDELFHYITKVINSFGETK